MTRYILAGHMGEIDKLSFPPSFNDDECLGTLDFIPFRRSLKFGIATALNQLSKLQIYPSEIALDLLAVAVMVQAADTRLNRIATSQDAWTREIKLIVPVSSPTIWNDAADVLQRMLNFLTGDLWSFEFRPRPSQFGLLIPRKATKTHDYAGVSLFSGGLDSLVGAIDALEKDTSHAPFFVSHAGEAAVSSPQASVFAALEKKYKGRQLNRLRFPSARFPKNIFPGIGSENSTRGRSFLFFALGVFSGSGLGKAFTLRVPENGLIALNVPLDSNRLGSLSTRTTHPYYIHRWNELLKVLKIDGNVVNPYWDKTKGEMVDECESRDFLKSIVHLSVSCAHPSADRYHGGGKSHCGHCVPCLIRRAATFKAWGSRGDNTQYRLDNLTEKPLISTKAEGIQIRSFQYALARINKNPLLTDILIHKPGPLTEDADKLTALAGIYKRGMQEVQEVIKGVVTTP